MEGAVLRARTDAWGRAALALAALVALLATLPPIGEPDLYFHLAGGDARDHRPLVERPPNRPRAAAARRAPLARRPTLPGRRPPRAPARGTAAPPPGHACNSLWDSALLVRPRGRQGRPLRRRVEP